MPDGNEILAAPAKERWDRESAYRLPELDRYVSDQQSCPAGTSFCLTSERRQQGLPRPSSYGGLADDAELTVGLETSGGRELTVGRVM